MINDLAVWMPLHLLHLFFAILTILVSLTFNKFYLQYKFARVLAMERESPKNLISFSYILKSALVLVIICIVVIVFQLTENQLVPVGACSYIILISIVMGCFANKQNIKIYFWHYLVQVYYSNSFLLYMPQMLQRGRVMPTC